MRALICWSHSILASLLLVVFLSVLPVMTVVLWTGIELRRSATDEIVNEAARALRSIEYQQRLIFETTEQLLQGVSIWPSIPERNIARLNELLAALLARHRTYATIVIADSSGEVFASALPVPLFSVADRDYFRLVLDSRRFSVGSLVSSRSTGLPVIPFALPVLDASGEIDAVLIASYHVDRYNDLISADVIPGGWTVEIADRNGVSVFRYPSESAAPIGLPVPDDLWTLLSSQDYFEGRYVDQHGIPYQMVGHAFSVAPGSQPDTYAIVRAEVGAITPAVQHVVNRIVILGALSIVFAAAVTVTLGRSVIVSRLQRLVSAADALAQGDLASRSELPYGHGEVGQLAGAFDSMAEALQNRIAGEERANRQLAASLSEKNVLLKEVHHRVKNNFQVVSSLLRLQAAGISDAMVKQQFAESENRIRSMALIHEKLYQSDSSSEIDFSDYIRTVVRSIRNIYAATEEMVDIEVQADTVSLPLDRAVPLALIINELVTNACKHAFRPNEAGKISISLTRIRPSILRLEVADNGFPGDEKQEEQTLGVQLIQALAAQLGADIGFQRNGGTRCICFFAEQATTRERTNSS